MFEGSADNALVDAAADRPFVAAERLPARLSRSRPPRDSVPAAKAWLVDRQPRISLFALRSSDGAIAHLCDEAHVPGNIMPWRVPDEACVFLHEMTHMGGFGCVIYRDMGGHHDESLHCSLCAEVEMQWPAEPPPPHGAPLALDAGDATLRLLVTGSATGSGTYIERMCVDEQEVLQLFAPADWQRAA